MKPSLKAHSVALACLLSTLPSLAQTSANYEPNRTQARSMVITKFGIVATNQTLASAAGIKVLENGGNAIDAAIAANAVMGLVEPDADGIGGDLFAIIYEAKTGKLYGLNASGWAPTGLTPAFLKAKHFDAVPHRGIYSVTVPGAVAGWDMMRQRFGTMGFDTLLAPAIYYAENGFPVTELISHDWAEEYDKLSAEPDAKKLYLPDGKVPVIGQMFFNRELGQTYREIALHGRDGFYKGKVAADILAKSSALGGTMTADDLSSFEGEWVTPVSTTYRGWKVTELPPNGQGIAALEMLNIMERFPMGQYGHNTAQSLHVEIEAKKYAYADLLKYVGDPRFSKIPVTQLISKQLGEQHSKEIDPKHAACHVVPADLQPIAKLPVSGTTYLTTIDTEGNIVSLIQSVFQGFGSDVAVPGAGFVLQNRGSLFTLQPDQPNTLAPRKRPLHTIIPAFMEKDDIKIGFGIMNGWNQAQAHAQFVANIVDYHMNIQDAMEAARFVKTTFEGCDLMMETRVPKQVRNELTSMGHQIKLVGPFSQEMGGGQAVMINGQGVKFGASDARKDGAAVPQSPDFMHTTASDIHSK
jgi:gamma-glutamyltranspeptidase/glutathione hydrolase